MPPEEKKSIADLSDAELDAMSTEEVNALVAQSEGGEPAPGDASGEGAGDDDAGNKDGAADGGDADDKGDDDKGGKGEGDDAGDDDGEGDDAGDKGDKEELTLEQLAALAAEGDNRMVPLSRLNEALRRSDDYATLLREALAARGEPQQPQQPQAPAEPEPPQYDFAAAMREYHKMVTEGEDDKAADKLVEIETKRAEVMEYRLEQQARALREESAKERSNIERRTAIESAMVELYEAFPFLNNQSKDADEVAILAVNARAKELVAKGKNPADALREAGNSIGERFQKLLGKQAPATTDEGGDKGRQAPKDGSDPRSKEALRRNLDIRQPETQKSGVGNRDAISTIDISKMTDEQLDKLEKSDPATFAEIRGDNRIG